MSVKINAKEELGIAKPFEVKESNKNVRMTWLMQKVLAKVAIDQEQSDNEATNFEKSLASMLEMQDTVIKYIVDILGLTEDQAERIQDNNFDDTVSFAQRIAAAIMHVEMVGASEEEVGLKD